MDIIIASGANYFKIDGFPILVGRCVTNRKADDPPPHPHDLTEIEHSHDFAELSIVIQGSGIQCLEGVDLPITAGDVFLLQGQQRHYFHSRQDLIMLNVMYDPEQLEFPESELRKIPGYCAMFLLEPSFRKQHRFTSRLHLERFHLAQVQAICEEMSFESNSNIPGRQVVLRAKLLELIVFLSRAYLSGESTEAHALLRVGEIIGNLESNFKRNWKLDELAKLGHMSKSNLLIIFRKATGQTPIDYLMRLRIQRAMEMLKTGGRTVTEIAFAVGFNDSNYFTRQFKKVSGLTPLQFRHRS